MNQPVEGSVFKATAKVEEDITVVVVYCDKTTKEERFAPSLWGEMSASDCYNRHLAIGQENLSVFGRSRFPHVARVELKKTNGDVNCAGFTCECGNKALGATA